MSGGSAKVSSQYSTGRTSGPRQDNKMDLTAVLPTIYTDTTEYCRRCSSCQNVGGKKTGRAVCPAYSHHTLPDGLVERFNQTLKLMLWKVMIKEGKDWDKL